MLSTLSCLRHSLVSSVRPFGILGDGPKSGASVCDVFFFCHFPIRCSGSGVILIVSIPDICVHPHFLYSPEYRLTRNTVYCAISRLGMSVTTQGGSGRQFVTGPGQNIFKYSRR